MRCVIIESPYAGDVGQNVLYARRCVRDSLMRGEAPFASHLLYPQAGILDDAAPAEREMGIDAGFAWGIYADAHIFYTDRGWSPGMIAAYRKCIALKQKRLVRSLDALPLPFPEDL